MRAIRGMAGWLAIVAALMFASQLALGQRVDQAQQEMTAAMTAAKQTAVSGPAEVALIDQAKFKVPDDFVFVPAAEARLIMRAMGNSGGESLLGLLFPTTKGEGWFVAVQYEKSGYIKDDDARDWNADELLTNIKEGTEATNKERKTRGIPEMEVLGWVEKPKYDAATHQLKWSISSKDKGAPATADQGVNYNTYALGREGYISMNLVTDLKDVEAQKPMAAKLLSGLSFNSGKRYADFNESTDHVAEYGLAALIGGVAAKKLGLLAILGVFFAKFFKVIVVGGLAAIYGVFKLKGRKKEVVATTQATPGETPPADPASPNYKPPWN